MDRVEAMFAAAQRHKGMLDGTEKDITRIRKEIGIKTTELSKMNTRHDDLEWSYKYLGELVRDESGRFIAKLQEILNFGVRTIFDDRDYSIEIKTEEGKRASVHLVYDDEEGNRISPDIRDCGGGIRTVVGVLMQIFFIFHYGVEKLLVIDEGLSQVSDAYLPNLFGLLDELARKNNLKVLLVTHDRRMTEYASKQYVVEDHKALLLD